MKNKNNFGFPLEYKKHPEGKENHEHFDNYAKIYWREDAI